MYELVVETRDQTVFDKIIASFLPQEIHMSTVNFYFPKIASGAASFGVYSVRFIHIIDIAKVGDF